MPRPRLRFGITSTSSTSRLITLSATVVATAAAAAAAATVVVDCGEAVMEVAAEGERDEGRGKGGRDEEGKNNEMNIRRESRNYYTGTGDEGGRGGADSVSLYKLEAGSGIDISLYEGSNAEEQFVSYAERGMIIHSSDVLDL